MLFVALISLTLTVWLAARGTRPLPRLPAKPAVPRCARNIATCALPFTFWLQVRLAAMEAAQDRLHDAWAATLPLPIAYNFGAWRLTDAISVPFATFLCVVAGSAALLIICYDPPRSRAGRCALAVAGLTQAGLALFSPVVTSSDVYMYVFAAGAGHAIYAPPADLYGPANVVMNRHIGLRGALYGPAWIALNGLVGSLGHTTLEKIFALRAFNALLLFASVAALRAAGASGRSQLAFALNPMLWFYVVANAHNDIVAIFPCLVALCVVRRSVVLAATLVALAGCIKLPFLLLGMLVFARRGERAPAWHGAGVALVLCLCVSWSFGGAAYARGFMTFAHASNAIGNARLHVFGMCASLLALGLVGYAFTTGRYVRGAALLMANLSPFVFPWYMLWSVPYAVAAGRGLTLTLLALPLAAFLADDVYALHAAGAAAFVTLALFCAFDLSHGRRARVALLS